MNGVRLAYHDVGEGPAILFIYGFMFDRTMWRGQSRGARKWPRIAPDPRGHGLSIPVLAIGIRVSCDCYDAFLGQTAIATALPERTFRECCASGSDIQKIYIRSFHAKYAVLMCGWPSSQMEAIKHRVEASGSSTCVRPFQRIG